VIVGGLVVLVAIVLSASIFRCSAGRCGKSGARPETSFHTVEPEARSTNLDHVDEVARLPAAVATATAAAAAVSESAGPRRPPSPCGIQDGRVMLSDLHVNFDADHVDAHSDHTVHSEHTLERWAWDTLLCTHPAKPPRCVARQDHRGPTCLPPVPLGRWCTDHNTFASSHHEFLNS